MVFRTSLRAGSIGLAVAALSAGAALAQAPATAAAAVPNKGDTAWMLVSTLLVLFMTLPGLALFYGGLTRSKNMLSVMSQITATAAVMCPIALGAAGQLDAQPQSFLMAVAIGASCAFLTPSGHQNNSLILGPGGLKFGDYWRLGLSLEIVVVLVAVPMLLWV